MENIEAKRSIIKRIFEKDAAISSHMVLLVGEIKVKQEIGGLKYYTIELSDGWYSLYAEVKYEIIPARTPIAHATNNALITKLIREGKLAPGVKIEVCGLHYKNKNGPQAGNPLEVSNAAAIVELSYNSMTRARWNSKLGECPSKLARKSLKSLRPNGGFVSMVDAFVEKKYALVEKTQMGLRQINYNNFEEGGSNSNGRWGLSFRLKLRDACHFYTQLEDDADPYVEIEISHHALEWYEKLGEGARVLLCNLKTIPRFDKNSSYFDFRTYSSKCSSIFLQTTPQSAMQSYAELRVPKNRYQEIKEYGKSIASQIFSLNDVQTPSETPEEDFYSMLKRQRNEVIVQGVVIECIGPMILGVLSTESFFLIEVKLY